MVKHEDNTKPKTHNAEKTKELTSKTNDALMRKEPAMRGAKATVSQEAQAPSKDNKVARQRQENETTNKNKDDQVDREWMLQEFYKNLAMSSASMKRKRDSSRYAASTVWDSLYNYL